MSRLVLELKPPESRHYRTWRERIRAVAHFQHPDRIHALCEEAQTVGVDAILAVADPGIREALLAFTRWRRTSVWAVVPNMQAFIRDLTNLGMVGAARARFQRLALHQMVQVGMQAARQITGVISKDFATGVGVVSDMELAGLHPLKVSRLLLHPQVTEVALAGGVTAVFHHLLAQAARVGAEPGLITNNLVRAAEILGADLSRFAVIVTPCNPRGYKMFPAREACEALLRSAPRQFLASEATAGGAVSWAEGWAHAQGLGLAGALISPDDVLGLYRRRAAG